MMGNNTPSLTAENITLTRDGRKILDGVSLAVKPGSFLAVIGPNGAGKSSLLSIMSGLWTADSGHVMLNGRGIGEYRPAERARQCAVMRQDNARPAGMTVLEAVELGRLACGSAGNGPSAAWEVLQKMDLIDLAGRDCGRLSGGEWQRVAFARTVAQVADGKNAGVLLLDEPVSSLDPSHQHHLLGQARGLSRSGYAVLAILHDLNLTASYADEVVMLRQGRVLENGPVAEMMTPKKLSAVYGCRIDAVENPEGKRALLSLP